MSVTRIGLVVVAIVLAIAGTYAVFRAIDERAAPPIVIEDAAADFPIVVEVRGAVNSPGVYDLPNGARLQDAIDAAGGLTDAADRSTVNLARRIRDGDLVMVPASPGLAGSPAANRGAVTEADAGNPGDQRLSINTASAAELVALPGIGDVTAARIVAFREDHGPYRSIDDLVHVEGISSRTIDGLRDLVTTAP